MARIKLASPIGGIRGTVGGVTYSANATSLYAKLWRGPRPSGTRLASKTRCLFGSNGGPWRALSQAKRDAWDTWAALPAQELTDSLGQAYYASGWNWFVTLSSRLAWIERDIVEDPPSVARPAAPSISSVVLETSGIGADSRITYPEDEFDGWDIVLFGRLSLSQGAVARTAGFYQILASQAPGATSTSVQSQLESVFGTIPSGARLFASVARQLPDGQRSQPAAEYGDS